MLKEDLILAEIRALRQEIAEWKHGGSYEKPLSTSALAKREGVGMQKVIKWIKEEGLPARKEGERFKISLQDFIIWNNNKKTRNSNPRVRLNNRTGKDIFKKIIRDFHDSREQ